MRLAPDATVDDGLLDLFVLGDTPPWEILARLPSVYRGDHVGHPGTHILRTTRVSARSVEPMAIQTDGEPGGELPAVFEIVPAAITVLT
jgi:diacylglycerol kinase (ATP)